MMGDYRFSFFVLQLQLIYFSCLIFVASVLQDEEQDVFKRDFSAPTLEDHFNKTILPKVMQVSTRTVYFLNPLHWFCIGFNTHPHSDYN